MTVSLSTHVFKRPSTIWQCRSKSSRSMIIAIILKTCRSTRSGIVPHRRQTSYYCPSRSGWTCQIESFQVAPNLTDSSRHSLILLVMAIFLLPRIDLATTRVFAPTSLSSHSSCKVRNRVAGDNRATLTSPQFLHLVIQFHRQLWLNIIEVQPAEATFQQEISIARQNIRAWPDQTTSAKEARGHIPLLRAGIKGRSLTIKPATSAPSREIQVQTRQVLC